MKKVASTSTIRVSAKLNKRRNTNRGQRPLTHRGRRDLPATLLSIAVGKSWLPSTGWRCPGSAGRSDFIAACDFMMCSSLGSAATMFLDIG